MNENSSPTYNRLGTITVMADPNLNSFYGPAVEAMLQKLAEAKSRKK